MQWEPISETRLWDEINRSWDRMSFDQRHLWELIKIAPEKWQLPPDGDEGGGFWVVGIYGHNVLWFNDIEDGFNRSTYTSHSTINEYWCNQDNLEWQLQNILEELKSGTPSGQYAGPHQPFA